MLILIILRKVPVAWVFQALNAHCLTCFSLVCNALAYNSVAVCFVSFPCVPTARVSLELDWPW